MLACATCAMVATARHQQPAHCHASPSSELGQLKLLKWQLPKPAATAALQPGCSRLIAKLQVRLSFANVLAL